MPYAGGTTLPDNDLPTGLIRAIAARAFGATDVLQRVRPIAGGTVNTALLLERVAAPPAILRIAPSVAVAEAGPSWLTLWGLRREQAVIALLPHLGHLLPRIIHTDFSHTLIDRDWVVQGLVRGEPWSDVASARRLTNEQERDLWRQTGSLTRSIHDVRGDHFGAPGAAETGVRSADWSSVIEADARGLLDDAGRFALPAAVPVLERLAQAIEHHRGELDAVTTPGLIHSDLDPRHIFIAPNEAGQYRISGLIDLEFGRFADPRSESLIVGMALDPPPATFRQAFREGYGPFPEPPGSEVRASIYQAISLGWTLTDLTRLGQREGIPAIATRLRALLDRLDAGSG
ncbi:MAG: aminoglycoside phosphotransferase family protein [Thermomicrobiales bacterium]